MIKHWRYIAAFDSSIADDDNEDDSGTAGLSSQSILAAPWAVIHMMHTLAEVTTHYAANVVVEGKNFGS